LSIFHQKVQPDHAFDIISLQRPEPLPL